MKKEDEEKIKAFIESGDSDSLKDFIEKTFSSVTLKSEERGAIYAQIITALSKAKIDMLGPVVESMRELFKEKGEIQRMKREVDDQIKIADIKLSI